jgi:hypothetical protein
LKSPLTRGLAAFGLLAVLVSSAGAQTPAITITSATTTGISNPPFTLGYQFTANSALSVSALGLYDEGLDGLADSYPIGLFDSGGSLVASASLPSGTSATLINQFRYVNITPVSLTAGQDYRIGALFTTGNDSMVFPGFPVTGFATDPRITFVGPRYIDGGALTDPTGQFDEFVIGYFGPNLLISASAVPEPGNLALLAGLGLTGAGLLRRRRK